VTAPDASFVVFVVVVVVVPPPLVVVVVVSVEPVTVPEASRVVVVVLDFDTPEAQGRHRVVPLKVPGHSPVAQTPSVPAVGGGSDSYSSAAPEGASSPV
jgi:hypothetical protein